MDLDLNKIVGIFAILEAVAVAASLIFIGIQIRAARKVATGSAYQSWLDTVNDFYAALAQSPDLAYIYWKGRTNLSKLNEKELPRFFYLCVQWFSLLENLHVQYHQGLIPVEFYTPWQEALRIDLADKGLQEYWRLEREQYNLEFRKHVDRLVLRVDDQSIVNEFQKLTTGKMFSKSRKNSSRNKT